MHGGSRQVDRAAAAAGLPGERNDGFVAPYGMRMHTCVRLAHHDRACGFSCPLLSLDRNGLPAMLMPMHARDAVRLHSILARPGRRPA